MGIFVFHDRREKETRTRTTPTRDEQQRARTQTTLRRRREKERDHERGRRRRRRKKRVNAETFSFRRIRLPFDGYFYIQLLCTLKNFLSKRSQHSFCGCAVIVSRIFRRTERLQNFEFSESGAFLRRIVFVAFRRFLEYHRGATQKRCQKCGGVSAHRDVPKAFQRKMSAAKFTRARIYIG